MRNAVLIFLTTFILSGILLNFFPWWIIAPVALLSTFLFYCKPFIGFLAAFLGTGLLWGVFAGYLDAQNEGLLSSQLGQIFKGLSSMGLIIVTGVLGGLVSGFAAMTGSHFRKLFFKTDLNES